MIRNEKTGERWIHRRIGGNGRTRIKRRKGKIAFTLSPEDFRTDTQQDMVKDEASRPFNENLKICVHPPFPCSPRIYLSPQLFYYQLLTVKLHLRPLISIRFLM